MGNMDTLGLTLESEIGKISNIEADLGKLTALLSWL
jgi:hypothetical protein